MEMPVVAILDVLITDQVAVVVVPGELVNSQQFVPNPVKAEKVARRV
jgi:hypothetical protein